MFVKVLKSKIHKATVTETELDYIGSISIDPELIEAAGLRENEQVLVANLNNGIRHETYVQAGKRGSGGVSLNGPGARLARVGDQLVIMGFGYYKADEQIAAPKIIFPNKKNQVSSKMSGPR